MAKASTHPIIVCAVDLSDPYPRPVAIATELAEKLDATLHLLHVESSASGTLTADQHEELESEFGAYAKKLQPAPSKVALYVASGNPADEILMYAESLGARFIVMGTHGRSGLARAIVGSVAESVVRGATCPVVVVPLRE